MKAKVIILDSSCNVDMDYCNFIFFMTSKSVKDHPTTTWKGQKFSKEEEDYQNELLDSYNELLREHTKSKERNEKDKDLRALKAALEKTRSSK